MHAEGWEMLSRGIALFCLLAGAPGVLAQAPDAAGPTGTWTISKVVDNVTECPNGKGMFKPGLYFPAIDGQWVVFWDQGSDHCTADNGPSIWSYNLISGKLSKLVDTSTEVPFAGSGGKFTKFVPVNSDNLQVRDGTVLFYGEDAGFNLKTSCRGGLYTVPVGGGAVRRVVDYTMTLPGFGGKFCGVNSAYNNNGVLGMSIDDGTVVFSGSGVASGEPANDGVWWAPANVNSTEADLHLIADFSTGYKTKFPKDCAEESCWVINAWAQGFIRDGTVVLAGSAGNPGPWGLFIDSPGSPILLSNYVLPGDGNPDPNHPDQASVYGQPILDGDNVFFIGVDPFYQGSCGKPSNGQGWFGGVFQTSLAGGTAASLMNSCDRQPNGDKLYGQNSFNYLVASEGTAVFAVEDEETGYLVLDSYVNGKVVQLTGPRDPLPTGASCDGGYEAAGCAYSVNPPGSGAMSGGRVVFGATGGPYWYDEGIYVASLPCANTITGDFAIDLGKPSYDAKTATWTQTAKLTNTSMLTIDGPVSLALTDLKGGASLVNRNGATVCFAVPGSSYIDLSLSGNKLAPGKDAQVTLEFSAAADAKISFTAAVAGPGAR